MTGYLFYSFSVWVDTVWELDFTETERLASRLEGTITEDGVVAFTQLYKCLYPFAAKDTEIQEVSGNLVAAKRCLLYSDNW